MWEGWVITRTRHHGSQVRGTRTPQRSLAAVADRCMRLGAQILWGNWEIFHVTDKEAKAQPRIALSIGHIPDPVPSWFNPAHGTNTSLGLLLGICPHIITKLSFHAL